MQNTIIQPSGQSVVKTGGTAKKPASASDQTAASTGENIDPYLQIFLSLLSQSTNVDEQAVSSSDSASDAVQQTAPQQSLLNILGLSDNKGSADILSALNAQNVTDTANTELPVKSSNEQGISELLSTMNVQSVSDLISSLNLQSTASTQNTASAQSAADLQSAAAIMSAVNSLKAAIIKASDNMQSPSVQQNPVASQGTQDIQSTVNAQNTVIPQSTVNSVDNTSDTVTENADAAQIQLSTEIVSDASKAADSNVKDVQRSDSSDFKVVQSSDSSNIKDVQSSVGSDSKASQTSAGTVIGAETKPTQAAAVSNQEPTSTELTAKAKHENAPQPTVASEAQNSGDKAEARQTGIQADKESVSADVPTAKDSSETASKSSDLVSGEEPEKKSSDKDVDLSSLQGDIAAGKEINSSGTVVKNVSETAEPKISEQIATDVSKNLALGKNEFTVKLKPESLGEITLKLSEADGRTTLTITTASAHTAKLINDDLSDLRAAVSQMNVHVSDAVAKTSDSQQSSLQQFGMAFQQSTGQQYSGGQAYSGTAHSSQNDSDAAYAEKSAGSLPNQNGQSVKSTGIDTYI